MQIDLSGQTVIVTGGAGSIGRATVDAFARAGAQVALFDLTSASAERAAAEVRLAGALCRGWACDVSSDEQVEAAVAGVEAEFGRIDTLVNNAGINSHHRKRLDEYSRQDWDDILRVDLTGVYLMSRAVLPGMLQRRTGAIVNISSIAGLVPLRLQSAYVAAKAGVANLTRSMAAEYGCDGIRVNAVAPGSTLSPGTEALFYGPDGTFHEKAASLISHIPLGRPGRPEEIAAAVLFLCSPQASYVSGAVLPVDGGWLAGYHRDW